MEIYVTDLAAYNEGNLVGEWVDISGEDSDSIEELISDLLEKWSEEAGVEREEYFISDYNDCPVSLGEYESIGAVLQRCRKRLRSMERLLLRLRIIAVLTLRVLMML